MNKWPRVSLGELLTLERRPVKVAPDSYYEEIGIYCFGRGIFHKPPRSGLEVGEKDLFLIKSGDFILQITFAWEGAVAVASREEDGMYGSVRFPTFRVSEGKCDPHYLLNYFRTHEGREQLIRICPGSAGRNRVLSIKRIPEVSVPLPPLSEQRGIVAKIDEVAIRIEKAQRLRQQLVEQLETLSVSTLSEVFDSFLETSPKNKLVCDSLAEVIAGQHVMANDYNRIGEGFPYITGPADFGAKIAEIKRWTHTPKTTAMPGDVLLTVKGAGVGKINFAPSNEVAIGRQLMAIRPNPAKLFQDFLFYFLKHRFSHFQSIATATTVPGFKKEDVKNLDIPILSLEKQQDIVAYLDNLQAKLDGLKQLQAQTAAELDALLPSILDKAFKGEL